MSSTLITIPSNYGLVILAATSTYFLTMYQSVKVGIMRHQAGIKYPQTHAEVAEMKENPAAVKFNCAQRAHANTLEALPNFLAALLLGGLRHPEIAASLGAAWLVGRIMYTQFYLSGDPAKRNRFGGGPIASLSLLGLQITAIVTGVQLYRGLW